MPLFDAHHGVVGPALSPQPLTSEASVPGAGVAAPSETSACTEKMSAVARAPALPANDGEDSSRRERKRDR